MLLRSFGNRDRVLDDLTRFLFFFFFFSGPFFFRLFTALLLPLSSRPDAFESLPVKMVVFFKSHAFFFFFFLFSQGRGPKKHLKKLNAPRHWQLAKLEGQWAPRPSAGPHKLRECLPLVILLRNRLKYAFTRSEVTAILMQRLVTVDNKVRTDVNFPAGFMDVISIPKTGEFFRLLFDVKGKFAVHRITKEEAAYKLCRVSKVSVGEKGVPFLATHDGRTIRYPDPDIKTNDSVRISLDGKILDFIKFEVGNLIMVTGGRNLGRVGVIEKREKHIGGFDIVHVKDSTGRSFATRVGNVFIIGKGSESYVSLPARKGVRLSLIEETEYRKQKERDIAAAGKAKGGKKHAAK